MSQPPPSFPPPPDPRYVPYAIPTSTPSSEHLRLLAIFHYIVGGISLLFSTLPLMHIALGAMLLSGSFPQPAGGAPPMPKEFGWIFIGAGICFMVFGYAISIAMLVAGYKLQNRRSYTFCFAIACVECIFMPLGTILGVFTIVVLNKPDAKAQFAA